MDFRQFYEQTTNNQDNDYEDFLHYLETKGWVWAGEGAFGIVYKKPNKNYVIKVYKDDEAYDNFLNFIERNQNDPHIPKIKRRILPLANNQSKNYGIVAIEQLDDLITYNKSDWTWVLVQQFQIQLYNSNIGNLSFDKYLEIVVEKVRKRYENDLEAEIKQLKNSVIMSRYRQKLRLLDYFVESNIEIFKTFYRLRKFLEKNNKTHTYDLHSGNFMIRPSTGEIVVTDPIAF
jgi:hypothetical protein